jgi:two-component system, OmpR family, sensor kinase
VLDSSGKVIRVGLLPLERIGRVTSEIAHGDLSKRVTLANDRTEVGRLGTSLNEMLAQIERAFADRTRSEQRLRRFLADASHELRTPLASIPVTLSCSGWVRRESRPRSSARWAESKPRR